MLQTVKTTNIRLREVDLLKIEESKVLLKEIENAIRGVTSTSQIFRLGPEVVILLKAELERLKGESNSENAARVEYLESLIDKLGIVYK